MQVKEPAFEKRIEQASNFLLSLFGDEPDGFVEWRAFCKDGNGNVARRRDFYPLPLRSPEGFAAEMVRLSDRNFDVYVGVLPRCEKRGVAETVTRARWMWADLDGKNMTAEQIDAAIIDADMVVRSGHGTHAYWNLTSPVPLESMKAKEAFVKMLRRLQCHISDGAADNVADLPRILRVPGTWNWKNGSRVPVTLEKCPRVSVPSTSPEFSPIGDDESERIRRGVMEMVSAAGHDAIPVLYPGWRSCRNHHINDVNVWLRGQLTWFEFFLNWQKRVPAYKDPAEALRVGRFIDACVDEMNEDFTNLFLELERRGFSPMNWRDNPLFSKEEVSAY